MRAHPVFADMPVTIFERMSGLARQHEAINLGQGFPDAPGPEDLRQVAAEAILKGSNQYAPSRGDPLLRKAVVEHYWRLQNVALTPDGVLVTSGATEAIAAALLAHVSPGDEVAIFEPAYDAYRPLIERAGGVVRAVPLEAPEWRLTEAAIEAAITARTRVLLFNNPMNPSARVFDAEEIAALARACMRRDVTVISDEVWEHIIFDGRPHHSLLAAQGLADRVIKIGSAGKMFGLTGWKVGFACGAPDLIAPVAKAHQFLTFSTPPNLQTAVVSGLAWPNARLELMRTELTRSRDRLARALIAEGYQLTPSEGTYFMGLDLAASGLSLDDETFCMRIVESFGVAAIPLSAFTTASMRRNVVRLCFAKNDAVLDEAARRLGQARRVLS